jgi:uncharacterized membrane protein YesL
MTMTTSTTARTGFPATLARLGDTMLLGAAVAGTSLGVVTAGPALAAAATVVRGWECGDAPSLRHTFVAAVRTQTRPLLLPQLSLVAVSALVWVDLVAAGNGLPGGAALRVLLGALGTLAVVSYLAMFAVRAAHGGTWFAAWLRAARLCAARPWLPVALAAVLAMVGLIVLAAPAMIVVAAGPLMLAVGVLVSRA